MTREEAIRILEVNKPVMTKRMSASTRRYVEAFEMAISALSDYDIMQKISLDLAFENDELMNKSRWIPVSERLPEEDGEYFVTKDLKYRGTKVSIAYWFKSDNYNHGFYKADEVIAWRELPEPYKAEKGGE